MRIEFVSSTALAAGNWATDGVLVVMPFTNPAEAQRSAHLMAKRAGTDGLLLGVYDEGLSAVPPPAGAVNSNKALVPPRAGFVAVVNAAFRASRSPWFCYVAQDAFAGRHWLALALAGLKEKDGVLAPFNDGKWHGQLAAFGLARREWASDLYQGDFFHPAYDRHYADVELTVHALQVQGLVYSPQSVLVEVDWEKDNKLVKPEDRRLYLSRVKTGFDGRITNAELLRRFK